MSERIASRGNPDSVRVFLGRIGLGATAAALATGLLFKPYLADDTCPPSISAETCQEFLEQKPSVVAGFVGVSMALGAAAGSILARQS